MNCCIHNNSFLLSFVVFVVLDTSAVHISVISFRPFFEKHAFFTELRLKQNEIFLDIQSSVKTVTRLMNAHAYKHETNGAVLATSPETIRNKIMKSPRYRVCVFRYFCINQGL